MNKDKKLEKFIHESKEVHGDKYDYTKTVYNGNINPLKITCPVHGEFQQIAKTHKKGAGCKLCQMYDNLTLREWFIKEARSLYEDLYDFSCTNFVDKKTKVGILCPKHGKFERLPKNFLTGKGCPKCTLLEHKDPSNFIKKSIKVHGNKYNYSKVNYINSSTEVEIGCPIHGTFYQTPKAHLTSNGCTMCNLYGSYKTPTEWFVCKADEVHEGQYDYRESVYINSSSKVKVYCTDHGVFEQTASSHLSGKGCPSCGVLSSARSKVADIESFIQKAKKVHSSHYDYSRVEYISATSKVEIICPVHGSFYQTPSRHLQGGCHKCANWRARHTIDSFIETSSLLHNDKYSYDKTVYETGRDKVTITCPSHGDFTQRAGTHLEGKGCKKCGGLLSKSEGLIKDSLEKIGLCVQQSNRKLIKPLELDLLIKEKKIAIEYNGIRWHSEKFGKDKHYHKNKTNLCKQQNYRLIHIWEDDFLKNPERELEFLKYSLGLYDREKVYARKTTIRIIPNKLGRDFLDKHHIQGSGTGSIYFGMYYQDELVAVTSFLVKKDSVELTRHVADRQVLGGLGKITKHTSRYFKQDILSFCDLSRFTGDSYLACGYEIDKEIPPDYKYVVNEERQHKFLWRKKHIKTKLPNIYDENLTEKEMMSLAGIPRIWDCGKLRLIYKHK